MHLTKVYDKVDDRRVFCDIERFEQFRQAWLANEHLPLEEQGLSEGWISMIPKPPNE
jgi:hypothetical protein